MVAGNGDGYLSSPSTDHGNVSKYSPFFDIVPPFWPSLPTIITKQLFVLNHKLFIGCYWVYYCCMIRSDTIQITPRSCGADCQDRRIQRAHGAPWVRLRLNGCLPCAAWHHRERRLGPPGLEAASCLTISRTVCCRTCRAAIVHDAR